MASKREKRDSRLDRERREGRGEACDEAGASDELPVPGESVAPGELSGHVGRHFELHAQLLQAMHSSHDRLVKALERGDRADVVVRSTDALNRTFRQLHESQASLAQELLRERRRGPWRVAVAVLAAGGLLAAAVLWVFHETIRPLGDEVGRLAQARAGAERDGVALADELRANGRRIFEAVDQGMAANRVLSNENRARQVEVERLREQIETFEARAVAAERAREAARGSTDEEALARATLERELTETRASLEAARTKLIDHDLAQTQLQELLAAARPEPAVAESSVASSAASLDGPVEAAPPTPEEQRREAVNTFLADAGLVGLRLLRSEGIVEGHLDRALFEIRNEQDYPIGFHDASRARFRVDPATMHGAIVMKGGGTVVRGVRSPFPGGELTLDIPAVAPGSFRSGVMSELTELIAPPEAGPIASTVVAPRVAVTSSDFDVGDAGDVSDVAEVVESAPSPPPEVESSAAAAPPPFDPVPLLATLNEQLRKDGGGRLEFDQVKGAGGSALLDVIAHHYGPSGQLSKTVVARSCEVEIDERDREVVFRFADGHHVTRGREVPFFQGRGADHGVWTYRVRGVDLDRWRAWVDAFDL